MTHRTEIEARRNLPGRDLQGQYVTQQQFNALRKRVDAIALTDDGIAYFTVNSTGPDSQANGNESVAIASGASANSEESVAVGYLATGSGPGSVCVGAYSLASETCSTSIGFDTLAQAYGAVAIGSAAIVDPLGNKGISIGNTAIVAGDSALAIGASATATGEQSVAIGAGSTTDRAQTVSVGNDSALRFIARVAAGQEDDDVATIGQLKEAGLPVNARGEVESALVLYDDRSKTRLTLPLVRVSGLRPAELSAQSTEAVTGSQLFKANQRLVELEARLAALERAVRDR
jgi:autotransporter adhesin